MEHDCKSCFDYVARISQKDNNASMKTKVNQFLAEVAERIHRLKVGNDQVAHGGARTRRISARKQNDDESVECISPLLRLLAERSQRPEAHRRLQDGHRVRARVQ